MGVTVGYGLLGFIDDYRKVKQRHSGGISARMKLFWQTALGVRASPSRSTTTRASTPCCAVPFFKNFTPHLGWVYVPLATFVIVAASNAVNLTDGLDGLAIGPVMIAAGTFLVLAYAAGARGDLRVPRDQVRARQRPPRDLLRRLDRRRARLPLVQRLAGAALHGRRRLARARRRARHDRRADPPGVPARRGRRHLRDRDALGDDPGVLVQAHAASACS